MNLPGANRWKVWIDPTWYVEVDARGYALGPIIETEHSLIVQLSREGARGHRRALELPRLDSDSARENSLRCQLVEARVVAEARRGKVRWSREGTAPMRLAEAVGGRGVGNNPAVKAREGIAPLLSEQGVVVGREGGIDVLLGDEGTIVRFPGFQPSPLDSGRSEHFFGVHVEEETACY